jgi:hypothetical protein
VRITPNCIVLTLEKEDILLILGFDGSLDYMFPKTEGCFVASIFITSVDSSLKAWLALRNPYATFSFGRLPNVSFLNKRLLNFD